MRRWSGFILGWGYLFAVLYFLIIVAGLVALLFPTAAIITELRGQFATSELKKPILYTLAAGAIVGAAYFVIALIRLYRHRRLIEHRGAQGRIQISPWAIRDFAKQTLESSWGLAPCRVRLRQTAQGTLRLRVQAALPASGNLMELSERIQAQLKERIEEQIGIAVDEVEVFAPRLGAPRPESQVEAPQAQDESYIDLGLASPLRAPRGEEERYG